MPAAVVCLVTIRIFKIVPAIRLSMLCFPSP
jgi:hypothetical protein